MSSSVPQEGEPPLKQRRTRSQTRKDPPKPPIQNLNNNDNDDESTQEDENPPIGNILGFNLATLETRYDHSDHEERIAEPHQAASQSDYLTTKPDVLLQFFKDFCHVCQMTHQVANKNGAITNKRMGGRGFKRLGAALVTHPGKTTIL
jgi:hypothetical protein